MHSISEHTLIPCKTLVMHVPICTSTRPQTELPTPWRTRQHPILQNKANFKIGNFPRVHPMESNVQKRRRSARGGNPTAEDRHLSLSRTPIRNLAGDPADQFEKTNPMSIWAT